MVLNDDNMIIIIFLINLRYYFYLGNSYHDSGKYNEAIPIYKKRIELGGWHEEVWYSSYRLGFCYYNLKQYRILTESLTK